MAKKVVKAPEKKTGSNALLESEYFTDIWITDPETGERKLHKKVKVKRYKSTSSLPTKRIVGQSEDVLGDDDLLEGYTDQGPDEE